jgi:two-component system, NtrC family, nitrogen regulation sensor histidine kinase NtrY
VKRFLQQVAAKNTIFLLSAGWLFTIAFVIDNYWFSTSSARYLHKNIEASLQAKERDYQPISKNLTLLTRLASQNYTEAELQLYSEANKGYCILIYKKDTTELTLKFWNSQMANPSADLLLYGDDNRLVKLRNGQYEMMRTRYKQPDGTELLAVGMLPVRREYFIENKNLKREFIGFPQAEKNIAISIDATQYAVKNIAGNTLFYIQAKFSSTQNTGNWLSLILNLMGVLLLLIVLHNTAHFVSEQYGYLKGTFLLVLLVLVFRTITYLYPGFIDVKEYELFSPSVYSSSIILSSLGDLLVNALLFCWIVLFLRREVGTKKLNIAFNSKWYWPALTVPVLFLLIVAFSMATVIKSLITDGQISFDVTNFFTLGAYSIAGFIIFATLCLSFYFLSQIIMQLVAPLIKDRIYVLYIIVAAEGLLLLTLMPNTSYVELNIYVLLWMIGYLWFMQQQIFSNWAITLSEVLVWLFIFSASISTIIIIENRQLEVEKRRRIAEKLASQADPSSERLLSIALTYIDNSFLTSNFDRFRRSAANLELKDSIINKNLSAYLAKYDTHIFTFDSSEAPLFNEYAVSYDTLNTIFKVDGRETNVADLKYFEKSFDKFSYIFRKSVADSVGNTMGYLFILSEPKRYKNDALVPVLFRSQKEDLPEYSDNYTFAIYNGMNMVDYYNEYEFPTKLDSTMLPAAEFEQRRKNGFNELWYRDGKKVVIIARRDNYLLQAITLFAWLFSIFIILLALFRVFTVLVQTRLHYQQIRQYFQVNLRSQIHGTFIFVTLVSFIVIGITTIFFFVNRYKRNNLDKLSKAIQIMNNQVKTEIGRHEAFDDMVKFYETGADNRLEEITKRVAEIHGADINFYDLNGNLVVSSNPFVYNKGILSEVMNPVAYYNLHQRRLVQYITDDEQMGSVSYQSIYSPARAEDGAPYAYLNIPSFDSQTELKREISNFLVTIINLNAFIFLIAGAIALFITNRITSSFTLISDKMRAINLGQANEEIVWNRNDEIGELVIEYNKMVNKLENSAAQLAKSEREGAWREMARQVAHEIKNPLTPMKLSIQYLQKAIGNNAPNIKEMTTNVAKTLVEQIDHLSRIAAEFSQFANIGNPKNEVFDLHEMLYSLSSLYKATESLQFEWNAVPQRIMLFADKTQLNRLFTNLLQNAVEACVGQPERKVVMSEQLENNYIIIQVTDNGYGIPEHIQEKIFTPNFTTKTSGTGLGLAMSKSIAEQAKGEIWFNTKEGAGTTFYVKLPLLRATN